MGHDAAGVLIPEAELQALRRRAADTEVLQRRAEVAERMLERETLIRETILWNLPLLLVTLSSNGEIISMNRHALERLDLTAETIEGEHFVRSLVPADWQSTADRYLEAALTADRPVVYTCPLQRSKGEPLPVEWHALPLRGAAQEPTVICQAGVVTGSRNGSTVPVRESDRLCALGQLTAGVAHDFNNLLQVIQGNVSLMLLDLDELLDQQVQSGAAMTRRLLAFTETGSSAVTRLELNQQVREVTEMFARARRDLAIELDLTTQATTVEADRRLLDQLVLDLLIHAAGHLQQGDRITVATSREAAEHGEQLHLSVWDSGQGPPPPGPDRHIGLARLAARLGAALERPSSGQDGTTVTIRLTAAADTPGLVAEEPRQPQGMGRVLLVDDEQVVLDVGARLLRKLGFEVTTAVGGREAVALCRQRPRFDVVILDLVMPDMSGREVFDRIMRIDPDTVVLVASGYSLRADASDLLARGAAGFLQKPFRLRELQERVTALVAR